MSATLVALIASGLAVARASSARTAHASAQGEAISVGGKHFFPIMLLDQCDASASAHARALGANLILNETCADAAAPKQVLSTLQAPPFGVLPIQNRSASGSGLVGWTFPDEPEDNGWTPAKLAAAFPYRRGSPDGLLSFVTTGAGFFARAPYKSSAVPPTTYGAFARLSDVAGFDLYPLNHCQQDLTAVHDAQQSFIRLAGQMPTFQWIETGPLNPTYCGGFTMTPAQLSAETWLAITGGARGIGFFTGTIAPTANPFDVSPSVQHAIKRLTSLLDALTPGLTGETVRSDVNSSEIEVDARVANGATYVFAVNASEGPIVAQVYVPTLSAGPLRVFGEKRTVAVANHRFNDRFAPLTTHVYVRSG